MMAFLAPAPLHQTISLSSSRCHSSTPVIPPPSISMSLLLRFSPSDFEIRRIVGQQGYATITDWEYYGPRSPLSPNRTVEPAKASIRLYEARITSSLPRLYNTRVLLKEFQAGAIEIGVTEAQAYQVLYENDGTGIDPDVIPVATLLGTFKTDQSFARQSFKDDWKIRFPMSPDPPSADSPFLVFRWEGLLSGLSCAMGKGEDTDPGTKLLNRWFPGNLRARKVSYTKTFMKRSLEALIYVHGTGGLVHRSVGLASLMVNTAEYRLASSLQVKLRDLGFAKPVSKLISDGDLEKARKAGAQSPGDIARFYFADDIYALGYAFFELVFSLFSGQPVTQDNLKSLFEDTFELNIENFKSYCEEDPNWTDAVDVLSEGNEKGWNLMKTMICARENFMSVSLQELAQDEFFEGLG